MSHVSTESLIPAVAVPSTTVRFAYHGRGAELFLITLTNTLLMMITLSFYRPWARAKLLRYVIENFAIEGDRLTFHGNGRELLRGYLIAMGVFIGIYAFLIIGSIISPGGSLVYSLAIFAALVVLGGLATFGSFRYRLTRTSWRGVRFAVIPERREFVGEWVVHSLLLMITFGFGMPYFVTWMRRGLAARARFGTLPFDFDGQGGPMFRRFLISWVLTIPTLGMIWIWYDGHLRRTLWNGTRLGDARFQLEFENGDWFEFQIVNGLILIGTLGIAWPWVQVRMMRFLAEHLTLEGPIDWTTIRPQAQSEGTAGEGLAGMMDTDLDIG